MLETRRNNKVHPKHKHEASRSVCFVLWPHPHPLNGRNDGEGKDGGSAEGWAEVSADYANLVLKHESRFITFLLLLADGFIQILCFYVYSTYGKQTFDLSAMLYRFGYTNELKSSFFRPIH